MIEKNKIDRNYYRSIRKSENKIVEILLSQKS